MGDELSTVDGQPVAGLESMFELSKLLLGLEGSKTALAFKKKGLHQLCRLKPQSLDPDPSIQDSTDLEL